MRIRPTLALIAALVLGMPAQAQQTSAPVILKENTEAAEMSATLPRVLFDTPGLAAKLVREGERQMASFAEDAAEARAQYGDSEHWRKWSLEIDHEVSWQNLRLSSVLRRTWIYTGGAHGNLALDSVIYDREAEKTLSLEDFFGPLSEGAPALKFMADHARRKLNEKLGEFSDPQWIAEGTQPKPATFQAFTLAPSTEADKAGGITIHFAPYAVAPYAAGPQQVTIPHEVLAEHLDPSRRHVFVGSPAIP